MALTVTLTDTDVKVLTSALEFYRLKKGAEGKLTSQKERTPEAIKKVQHRYDTLQECIKSVKEKLTHV